MSQIRLLIFFSDDVVTQTDFVFFPSRCGRMSALRMWRRRGDGGQGESSAAEQQHLRHHPAALWHFTRYWTTTPKKSLLYFTSFLLHNLTCEDTIQLNRHQTFMSGVACIPITFLAVFFFTAKLIWLIFYNKMSLRPCYDDIIGTLWCLTVKCMLRKCYFKTFYL